jgi:predicted PurR-regulated permease PerM
MTLAAFLVGLILMSYQVLQLFLAPIAWGLILVYVTWPLYRPLRSLLSPYASLSALLMTVVLALAFVVPVLWIIALLRAAVPEVYTHLIGVLNRGPDVLSLAVEDPAALRQQALQWLKPLQENSFQLIGDIGATAFKFGFAVLSAFFF